ncbi:hypothetical protein Tco_0168739, partial [Tanacetum coccineum]
ALKHANFDLETVGDQHKVQLNELNELCDHAYENTLREAPHAYPMSQIFEASRARGFVLRSQELQNPQLHFGNSDIQILSTNVYL